MTDDFRFPFKPGDWATDDQDRVAKVKSVWRCGDEVMLDLWIFTHKGKRVGRESPACGGPRTFEPACPAQHWERIGEPSFPITPQWISNGDGTASGRMWAGKRLPPANWKQPERRGGAKVSLPDDKLRRALKAIADGHNDARSLAREVLGL